MPEPPFDLNKAHRWFAVECNNQAWDLVEKPGRTADETQQMIHAAHASVLHWQSAGSALNRQRGENLLATVYAAAGDAAAAVRHAERCLSLSVQNVKEETPFDRATALGCAAKAHAVAGDASQADRLRTLAKAAAAALDNDDRGVFERLYG
jgi:ATP/maltotriose-dependent transcriptional regulator MalT